MGVRYRNATPGTLLSLAATVLLALVSFNTPLLKSIYFLTASFSSGTYSGTLHLGTLGYCLDSTCTGPQVGYTFDPNVLFNVSVFSIPTTITKYLTYTLILHIIALAFAAASTVFGLLSHIGSMSVWCFPTCFASIASSFSLLALVFDLVIFYIAKSRIDSVSGASASIGIAVWLTLAAWLVAGFAGCAYGVGNCCMSRRERQSSGDPSGKGGGYQDGYMAARDDNMRMQAINDERTRKQKQEQGLPSFQELERAPLTGGVNGEDKYLYDDPQPQQALRRDGSVLQGVGLGYGRRTPKVPGGYPQDGYAAYGGGAGAGGLARRGTMMTDAGGAGVGAGGLGVEQPQPEGYGGYYGNQQHNYTDNAYNDPYTQQPANYAYDPYTATSYAPQPTTSPGPNHSYPPQQANNLMPTPLPTPGPSGYAYNGGPTSSDSHYADPGPRVREADPYDAYDDGVGGIGAAAVQPGGYGGAYSGAGGGGGGGGGGIQAPQPQHLNHPTSSAAFLRSPQEPSYDYDSQRQEVVGAYNGGGGGGGGGGSYDQHQDYHAQGDLGGGGGRMDDGASGRPPSYGQVAGMGGGWQGHQQRNEKSGYM